MRILLVNNLFGDNARGGAEHVVEAEALALLEAGHKVAVLRSAEQNSREAAKGLTVYSLKAPNIYPYLELSKHGIASRFLWHLIDLFNLSAAIRAKSIIQRFKPDVVHTHNLMGLGYLFPRLLRWLGIRHVHTLHDVQLLHPSGALQIVEDGISLPFFAKLHANLTAGIFGSPEAVISPSFFLIKAHRKYRFFPKSQGVVIANPAPEIGSTRSNPEQPVFFFAGQLEKQKGIQTLIEAWNTWSGGRDSSLEIAGNGSLKSTVEEATKETRNIRYLGRLEKDELTKAYHRAAYVLLTSEIIENAPTAISEGYAQGAPSIAAITGGVPEMVEEGETGFLFRAGDVSALQDALSRALSAWQDGSWTKMSAAVREKAEGMTIDQHVEKLMKLYSDEPLSEEKKEE